MIFWRCWFADWPQRLSNWSCWSSMLENKSWWWPSNLQVFPVRVIYIRQQLDHLSCERIRTTISWQVPNDHNIQCVRGAFLCGLWYLCFPDISRSEGLETSFFIGADDTNRSNFVLWTIYWVPILGKINKQTFFFFTRFWSLWLVFISTNEPKQRKWKRHMETKVENSDPGWIE